MGKEPSDPEAQDEAQNEAQNEEMCQDMLKDEKELAEHTMLVDLATGEPAAPGERPARSAHGRGCRTGEHPFG